MFGQPRVVVLDPIPDWSFEPERAALARFGVELVVPGSTGEADEAIRDADVVVVTGVRRLEAGAIAGLRRAAGILCYSIGLDKVEAGAAAKAGIEVRNVPDYCTDEVAEHAVALLASKRLVRVIPPWRGWGARALAMAGRSGLRAAPLLRRQGDRHRIAFTAERTED